METAIIDTSKNWTIEDYLRLEEGNSAQLIAGKLIMSPSPSTQHQRIARALFEILSKSLEGEVFFAPLDLFIDNKNVFQPDIIYVSPGNKKIVTDRGIEGVPDLIIEILSPSNSFADRNQKKTKYLEIGITEYWIVDPGNKTIEIYNPEDFNTPKLFLAGSGEVTSVISPNILFHLENLFRIH